MLCVDEQRRVFETFRAERHGVVVHIFITVQLYLFMLLGIHSFPYHVPRAEHVKSSIGQNGEAQSSRAALRLFRSWNPFHSWRVAS